MLFKESSHLFKLLPHFISTFLYSKNIIIKSFEITSIIGFDAFIEIIIEGIS